MNTIQRHQLVWMLGLLLTVFFGWLSGYVDFHPDEAIYFDAIPVSMRNDSGAFYSAFYALIQQFHEGVEGARIASTMLGGGTFVAIALSVNSRRHLTPSQIFALFLAFALSYQAIFVFIRVRPEAAWWFCSAWAMYAIARLEGDGFARAWPLLTVIACLPMNHRLSWFACAFLAGYALLFFRREAGWRGAFSVGLVLVAGMLLNIMLRAWWLGVPLHSAFSSVLGGTSNQRLPLREFFGLVFYGAPLFLNDTASSANLYELLTGLKAGWLSHAFMQNLLWLLMFVLPFAGRTWKQRYIFSFPLLSFFGLWLSGYYNPTYAAGFSLYCVIAIAFCGLVVDGWQRKLAIIVVALSVINGASFILTRVIVHGPASYFSAIKTVHLLASNLGPGHKISIPERFSPAVSGLDLKISINFKTEVSADTDFLVIDSYDNLMYDFVPEFENMERSLRQQAKNMCLKKSITMPVYFGDQLFYEDQKINLLHRGSWFFRNSSNYTLSIFVKCKIDHD